MTGRSDYVVTIYLDGICRTLSCLALPILPLIRVKANCLAATGSVKGGNADKANVDSELAGDMKDRLLEGKLADMMHMSKYRRPEL